MSEEELIAKVKELEENQMKLLAFACAECGHINEGFLPKEDQ